MGNQPETHTMNTSKVFLTLSLLLSFSLISSFIVIEDDYTDYQDYPAIENFSNQQQPLKSQAIRGSGGFSITSIEFVGTVFLATLLAFAVLPYVQQTFNIESISRSVEDIPHHILSSLHDNLFHHHHGDKDEGFHDGSSTVEI